MAQTSKYYKQQRYVSYDSGNTWSPLNEFRKGAWIEDNSIDCGGSQTTYEKWEVVEGYLCSNGNKFEKERKYTSHDNINWTPTEEYREGDLLQADSSDCGYMEKWETVSIDEDWICDGDSNKYYKEIMYVSRDSGSTWVETSTYRKGELYESGATDCFKLHLEYSDGDEMYLPCDDATAITTTDTKYNEEYGGYDKYTKITDVTIGACVKSTGVETFNGYFPSCGCVPYTTELTSVTLYEGVEIIDQFSFAGQSKLTSLELPDTVKRLEFYSLVDAGLTALTIPSSVTYIAQQVLSRNRDLQSVVWNARVSTIPYGMFVGCTSLTSITFNYPIYRIKSDAFNGCDLITSLDFVPSTVNAIGNGAFLGSGIIDVVFPSGITTMEGAMFRECESLTSVTSFGDVTEIGSYCFYRCHNLMEMTLPSDLTSIGDHAFEGCSGLTSVEIASTITSIGAYAFYGCKNLAYVIVNATTPPTLGVGTAHSSKVNEAFDYTNNCPIYVPADSVAAYKRAIGWSDYASRIQAITQLEWRNMDINVDYYCIDDDKYYKQQLYAMEEGSWVAKDNYRRGAYYGSCSFADYKVIAYQDNGSPYQEVECNSSTTLTSGETNSLSKYHTSGVVIGDCVQVIGDRAFREFPYISSVTLSNSVTSIEWAAFVDTNIQEIIIPSGVTDIKRYAFSGCKRLVRVEIMGNSLQHIGVWAFNGTSAMTTFIIHTTTPPTLDGNSLPGSNIYVPAQSLNAYKTAEGWSIHADRIFAIPDS